MARTLTVAEYQASVSDEQVAEAQGEAQASRLIPDDIAFTGSAYLDAPQLASIADRLIGQHGFLGELAGADIRWFWKRKTGVAKGKLKVGLVKRASDFLGHFTDADFLVWLSATTAREGAFDDRKVEAAVFHQLCHIGTDDKGNYIYLPHDFEGFGQEIRHYGPWTEDLKIGGNAFQAAVQLGFEFSEADDEDDEEAE